MEIKCVGVLGSGIMGGGIAQMFAENDFEVLLWDVEHDFAVKGMAGIEKRLRKSLEKGGIDAGAFSRITGHLRIADSLEALGGAQLIIEAVIEDFEVKSNLYKQLEQVISADTVVGTNTSSLSVNELAAAWRDPSRFLGVHFFNPPTKLELVEMIMTGRESETAVAAVRTVLDKCRKTPVQVKDSPGFIVNRLLLPMINEAAKLVDEGVASVEDIDTAMNLGALHPAGPLKVADLIGLDVCMKILDGMAVSLDNPFYRPAPAIAGRVRAGKLGRKSGAGFYNY